MVTRRQILVLAGLGALAAVVANHLATQTIDRIAGDLL